MYTMFSQKKKPPRRPARVGSVGLRRHCRSVLPSVYAGDLRCHLRLHHPLRSLCVELPAFLLQLEVRHEVGDLLALLGPVHRGSRLRFPRPDVTVQHCFVVSPSACTTLVSASTSVPAICVVVCARATSARACSESRATLPCAVLTCSSALASVCVTRDVFACLGVLGGQRCLPHYNRGLHIRVWSGDERGPPRASRRYHHVTHAPGGGRTLTSAYRCRS